MSGCTNAGIAARFVREIHRAPSSSILGTKTKVNIFFIYRNHIGYTGACPGTSLVNRWHDDISKMQYKTKIEIYGLYREGSWAYVYYGNETLKRSRTDADNLILG